MRKHKKYGHLTQTERDRIQALLNSGHKQKEIAQVLGRNKGTISREINRNRRKIRRIGGILNGEYSATTAQNKARTRRRNASWQGQKIENNNKLKACIISKLEKDWSPEVISGHLKDNETFYASKTAIYDWLYSANAQRYCQYLYSKRYKKRKRKKKTERVLIPNRKGLELRPKGAGKRYGHWEGDTAVSGKKTGSKAALAVIFEKKARYVKIKKITNLKPANFNQALTKMSKKVSKVKSLTLDNGIENTKHEELAFPAFFCDPYSSWQKGGVENVIKLIRRYVKKGSDISQYSDKYIQRVEDILNNKPRKSLNYQTPKEVMLKNNLLINFENENVALRG